MKVLHTEWMGENGGQAIRVIEDLKIIDEIGFTPFLACKPNKWLYDQALKEGITVFPTSFSHIADMNSLYRLYKIIKEHQIDIVHTHSSKDSYVATIAAKMAGAKVVRSRHIELTKKPGVIYKLADFIITTGERVKNEFVSYGFDENKIVSIPTYPDEEKFQTSEQKRRELQKQYRTEGMLVVGMMTGLHARKRPLSLLPLMRDVIAKNPNVKLLIAGTKFDDQMEKLNKMIIDHKLEKNVAFVGFVNPETFLNVIDIYVCPSEKEGVPQSLMQAMMMNKAVVSTSVGSIVDLNIDDNLLMVDKDDMQGLKEALIRLVTDSELRKELSDKNHKVMMEHFSRNIMKQKMKEIYEILYKQD